MKKLNVVQIGVGHDHAHDAVKFLKSSKQINFIGYVKFANEEDVFNIHKNDYEALKELTLDTVYKMTNLDCVFIDTDDRYLTEFAIEFVKRGIPIELDKPGSQDPDSFEELFKLAKELNVPIHMGYMYRYNPAVKKVKEIISSNKLGKVKYVELDMSTFHNQEKRKWLSNFKGGMMYFLGCHLIDLMLQFQGEPDEIIPLNRRSEDGVGEDVGFAKFKYGEHYSLITTSAVDPVGFPNRHINIYFEKGSVIVKPIELFDEQGFITTHLIINTNGKDEEIPISSFKRYDEMYNEFFDIVRNKITNPYSYDYEVLLHKILLKACNYRR